MNNIIELYGTLILTLLSFIVPILTILISLFPQGIKSLALKYENERKQSEENISNETNKIKKEEGLDYKALTKTLKTLQNKKTEAELKLQYLKPKKLMLKTAVPLLVALIGVGVALFPGSLSVILLVLFFSLLAFISGLMAIFVSITVLFEVGEIVNNAKNSNDEKLIELLSILVEKSGVENLYLKENDIRIHFDNKILKDGESIDRSINTKHSLLIAIENISEKMAKNFELGFIFPKDVLIEKTSNLSIYTDTIGQIVRFNKDMIQSHEKNLQGNLVITFLKSEKIKVNVFIKGENVKYQKFSFGINIVK